MNLIYGCKLPPIWVFTKKPNRKSKKATAQGKFESARKSGRTTVTVVPLP